MMLNLDQEVTPNHWTVAQFIPFEPLTAAEEFNLIAPLTIYHYADMRYKPEAREAIKSLMKLYHPIVDDAAIAILLRDAPEGLLSRYNALMMAIVHEQEPSATAFIDEQGAYSFNLGDSTTVLAGDVSGSFAFHTHAQSLLDRLDLQNNVKTKKQILKHRQL